MFRFLISVVQGVLPPHESISKDWREDKHVRILPWTANSLPLPVKMDGRMFSLFYFFFKSSCHVTGATPMSWFGQLPALLLAHLSLIVPISVTIKAKLFPFSLIVRTCAVLYTAPLRPGGSLWIKRFFGEAFQTWFVKFCSFFCQMDFSVNNFLDPSFSFHFSVSDSW